jgi:Zn-dependent alcohol dehydrogenase
MGLKVIGLDIAEQALEEARCCGADHGFNSKDDADWKKKVLEITGGGIDAAVNFTASKRSYDNCPDIIKPGPGSSYGRGYSARGLATQCSGYRTWTLSN